MARSRIHESQVVDTDFLSEDEHTTTDHSTVSGVPRSIVELNDTPLSYDDGKYLKSTASGTEWATVSGSSTAAGGISWTIVSGTSVNCVKDTGYLVDATNNDVLLHLPTSPSEGDTVGFCDFKNMAETNTITISGSNNIEGESATLNLNVNGAGFDLVYTDSERGWEIVSEIGAGSTNYRYVDRGDPASYDWQVGDFTTDNSWHDIDCSSIVSSDATAIIFRLLVKNNTAGEAFLLRNNGMTNTRVAHGCRTHVADIYAENLVVVSCDENQVVEYYGTNNGTWSTINVVIAGWFTAGGSAGGDVCADNDMTDNHLVRADGGAKKIQECSTITVDDSGRMVNTGQPKVKAYVNTTQNNVTGDDTLYSVTGSFWTENTDDGNNFSNGIFTAPVDGFYQFNITMYIQGIVSSSNHKRFDLLLYTSNGTFSLNRHVITNALAGLAGGGGSISVYLDANDTAYVQIKVANDTKVIGLSDNQSGFSGSLLC